MPKSGEFGHRETFGLYFLVRLEVMPFSSGIFSAIELFLSYFARECETQFSIARKARMYCIEASSIAHL